MSTPYADCAQKVRELHTAVLALERQCALLQLSSLRGREWFELLTRKLLPQLSDDAFLVVAVVGGTNIGKSVVFNHVAGCRASSTSPLASGTKHPVCLVPPGFAEQHKLQSIFEGFELHEWAASDEALEEHAEDRLFWQTSPSTPPNLLVLDTPDIDSDAQVNWRRADNIRRCSDVLIAVLTQQKYNDAAVKQFFRKAGSEDKSVVVVFNQCQLPDDEDYWPLWLETFCHETGIEPEIVYVAPNDRRAAEENRLAFYERIWPRPEDGANGQPAEGAQASDERSLLEDLSRLRFGEIKIQTLRGSLNRLLDPTDGIPAYLAEVRRRSGEFRSAAELLSAHSLAEIRDWPPVPNSLMVGEIRRWWQLQREGWSAGVHNFYNTVGAGLTWPFRFARDKLHGEQLPPIEVYRRQEWECMLKAIEKIYEQLQWIAELGNDLLRPRLEALLGGTSRVELLKTLEAEHRQVDFESDLRQLIATEMRSFQEESPNLHRTLRRLDQAAAVARPATSVVFFVAGFGPAGHAAAHLVADTAIQSIVHVAGDVAGGTVAAAVGETTLSKTAGSGAGYLEAKFRRLHSAFAAQRAGWLALMLKEHLLGALPEELKTAASMSQNEAYRQVATLLTELEQQMKVEPQESAA
jgi:hypothetical protein